MPTIDHAALFVTDLEAAREFFCTYFGATSNEQYHNPRTGLRTYFLDFGDGARLELMTRPDVTGIPAASDTGWNHVALRLGSREAVDEMAARLAADGYRITSGPRVTGDGYYEAVVLDGEGNPVELVG